MAQVRYRAIRTEPGLPEWLKNVEAPRPEINGTTVAQDEIIKTGDGLALGFWESMTPLVYRAVLTLVRRVEALAFNNGQADGYRAGQEAGRNEYKAQVERARKEGYESGHKDGYVKGFEVGQDMRDDAE